MGDNGEEMISERRQVVGVDGSPGSVRALEWALARADRFGPVEPVSAWHYPWWALVPTATGTLLPPGDREFQAIAERVVTRMLERAEADDHLPPVVIHGSAGPALVEAAERASLLVVGTRGRGAIAGSVLGSVSLHCVNHAAGPVAIVPSDVPFDDRHSRVVVGIDGSRHGQRALEWAVDNTPRSSRIDVIHAWDIGANAVAEVAVLLTERSEALSHQLVADAIAGVADRVEQTGHQLSGISRQGDARRILHSEAEQADLLIVGARGHQGVAHLLLGSVTTALVHHPTTATIVVR